MKGRNQTRVPAEILIGFLQEDNGTYEEDHRNCQQEDLGRTDNVGFQ